MIFDGAARVDTKTGYESYSHDCNSRDIENGKKISLSANRLEHYMRTEINKDQFQVDIRLELKSLKVSGLILILNHL